jgi:hypothetical protein
MAEIDITPKSEEAFNDTRENSSIGWDRVTPLAGAVIVLAGVLGPWALNQIEERISYVSDMKELRNPSAPNDCVTSAKWSGKLLLHTGANVRASDHLPPGAPSNLLGWVPKKTILHSQFCVTTDEYGSWYGVDAKLVNVLTKVPTAEDKDGVVYIPAAEAEFIQDESSKP